jgi:dTDP-4-dehydrorhamnose 3,5-epimerase-like enzyme
MVTRPIGLHAVHTIAQVEPQVHVIADLPDARGSNWSVPESLLPAGYTIRDVHVMTVVPGAVRGDHYHRNKHEIFLVRYLDTWILHWDDGSREFNGQGCAIVLVPPLLSHALHNLGQEPLHVVALSDAPYDPDRPDSHHRKVSSR